MVGVARGALASARGLIVPGRLMGIDPSLANTGIVILTDRGHVLRSHTIKTRPTHTEAEHVERLLNIANEVIGIARDFSVQYVAMEGFAHGKKWQSHQLGEVSGVIKTQLYLALRLIPMVVAPKESRAFLFGYGAPEKDVVESMITTDLCIDVKSGHEADAWVVGRWLFGQIAKEIAS